MSEMTQRDADQLEAWVKEMIVEQLRLLWRWVLAAWAEKVGLSKVPSAPGTPPGPPDPPITHHARTMRG